MNKTTPMQDLEARVAKLENAESYSDWFVGEWYQTFEQPLRKDVDALKEKQEKRDAKEYWDNLKSEGPTVNPKKSLSHALIETYWLSCFAWGLAGVVFTLVGLRFSGVI